MGFIAPIVGAIAGGKAIKKALTPNVPKVETSAQPAAAAASPEIKQETGVDTTGETLKRRARGKKGLMINPTNTSGGGSAGGTGLNI